MAKVVTPLMCKVQVIGKPRESKYEAGAYYHPTLFFDLSHPQNTESGKIWKNLSSQEAERLRVGDRVQLVPVGYDASGKPKHTIIVLEDAPEPSPTVPNTPPVADIAPVMSAQTKQEVANYVQQMAKLYGYCFGQASTELKDNHDLSEDSLRCVASSLFIAAQKRFSL